MIGRVTGTLAEKSPPQVLIDVGGVGYEIDVPMSTFYNLPALGERVTLLTHFVVRGARDLSAAGAHQRRRPAHRAVDPVGAVSGRAGAGGHAAAGRAPGQGAWNRQEDRRTAVARAEGQARSGPRQADIVQALVALGYSERDAAAALKALPVDIGVSDGIKLALKALSR